MEELQFTAAPRENIDTWARVRGIMVWSIISIVIVLAAMAFFLVD